VVDSHATSNPDMSDIKSGKTGLKLSLSLGNSFYLIVVLCSLDLYVLCLTTPTQNNVLDMSYVGLGHHIG